MRPATSSLRASVIWSPPVPVDIYVDIGPVRTRLVVVLENKSLGFPGLLFEADEGTRTLDLLHGKVSGNGCDMLRLAAVKPNPGLN
jgi:hypothetical protein